MRKVYLWYVTGTFHGSHVYGVSEGQVRRLFHDFWNGESIIHVKKTSFYLDSD
jgi:hypothetical protein